MQDIDKAKSLLAAAGQSKPQRSTCSTTEGRAGQDEAATAFAQQASKAGVTINVKALDGTTFYGSQYLKYTFATDYWGTRNYLNQVRRQPRQALARPRRTTRRTGTTRRSTSSTCRR